MVSKVQAKAEGYDPNRLLDKLIYDNRYRTDAQLAAALEVARPVISKIRHAHLNIGASLLIRIHEEFGLSIAEQRQIIGDRRSKYRAGHSKKI